MRELMVRGIEVVFGDARFEVYVTHDIPDKDGNIYAPHFAPLLHQHIYYEMIFCTKGSAVFETDQVHETFCEGEVVIVRPGLWHHPVDKKACKVCVVSVFLSHGGENTGHYDHFRKVLEDFSQRPISVSSKLLRMVQEFDRIEEKDDLKGYCFRKAEGYTLLATLFDELNGYSGAASVKQPENNEHWTVALFEQMRNTDGLTADELSEKLGYSKVHISRIIKQNYGITLSEIRISARIGAAKKLLLEHPEMPVKEVAETVRFSNMSTFYYHFRKTEGCTPSAYRQRELEKENM